MTWLAYIGPGTGAPDGFGVSLVGAILISVVVLLFGSFAILMGVAVLGKRGPRRP